MVFERDIPSCSPREVLIRYLRRILQQVQNGIDSDCISFRLENLIDLLLRSAHLYQDGGQVLAVLRATLNGKMPSIWRWSHHMKELITWRPFCKFPFLRCLFACFVYASMCSAFLRVASVRTAFFVIPFYVLPVCVMPFCVLHLCVMPFSVLALCVMPLCVMPFCVMPFCVLPLRVLPLSVMPFTVMPFSAWYLYDSGSFSFSSFYRGLFYQLWLGIFQIWLKPLHV